jgi:Fe-S cluster assembly scaffold protein SufB
LRLRGVLDGSARAVARGLIRIGPGLPGCVGRQKEEILLLSKQASVAAMPDLEVASHEVTCGHAAAIGRPDPEKLYYMESRGLTRTEAMRLYAEGFLSDAPQA